ncbi:hypothetical protein P154DRAFT_516654 [Amniculicola lignicola CBS 123094]|uniref:Uncharacterized protein n=1 Tax=Amniculicola lignicola CBS 123094 TaxID=1392246 RepID=A0A6A5X4V3_9PLEO|nr:hypothetical protein P154DRAFT_516654 [Amniculicola lignicola CBS 123094]
MCIETKAPYRWTRCKVIPKHTFPNSSWTLCDKGKVLGTHACPDRKPFMDEANTGTTTRLGECPACADL